MSTDDRLERLERRVAVLEALVRVGQSGSEAAGQPPGIRDAPASPAPALAVARPSPEPARSAAPPPRCPAAFPDARLHRAVDRPARPPRCGRRRPPHGHRVSAQTLVRARVDLARHAVHRRRGAWRGGGRDRLAAAPAVSHLRRGAHRLWLRHHLPERVGRLPSLRGDPADDRHRRTRHGLGGARHGRLRDQRRSPRHHRRARRLHGPGPARQQRRQREPAPALPREHGRGTRPGRGAAGLAAHHVRGRGELFRRGHRRRGRGGRALGAVALRSDRRDGRTLCRTARAVVGDPAAHLLGWLGPAQRGERADGGPLAGVHRGSHPVGTGLVARAQKAQGPAAAGRRQESRQARREEYDGGLVGREALYFFTTPLLLGWAAYGLAPGRFDDAPGLLPLLVAVPYLLAGYLRSRPPFALVGATAMAVAAQAQWDGPSQVWALLALGLLWPALDHKLDRSDGRWYGVLTWCASIQHLFEDALGQRTAADAAFVGPWALALWGTTAVALALAAGLFKARAEEGEARLVRSGLWGFAGLLTLFGVTGEIRRYFELESPSQVTADLAAGLAVSAWWLIFAAAFIFVGFTRSIKPLRVAGLGVAGLAVVKVIFFDLSSLDALYRVGSVFLLGLVMLSLAYLYYRYDRPERAP